MVNYKVRCHPQYCDMDNPSVITNWIVYAWIMAPLYPILGTEIYPKTEREAKKIARLMRKDLTLALS